MIESKEDAQTKDVEFEARVFQNKTNKQYSFIPNKKDMPKEIVDMLGNPGVVGLKLKIIKVLTKLPKKSKLTKEEQIIKGRKKSREYYYANTEKSNARSRKYYRDHV